MKCCPNCFGDRGFRKNIFPLRSAESGECSFCRSHDVDLLPPSLLAEYFELLISAYTPDEHGKLLVEWFRSDWALFTHPRMDDPRVTELLTRILDDGEIVKQPFSPAAIAGADRLGEWEELRDELMYQNRFFPETNIDLVRLEFLLSPLTLEADEVPNHWHRARIRSGAAVYPLEEMGAPPKGSAAHGRANPAGIPYLYLGSTPETSISEIRPHTGEIVCVATFGTADDLRLVDLRNARQMVSPFLLEDADDISQMRMDLPFLERLGDELTRPVVPSAAAVDYIPSQYVCEIIKKRGYDGVVYRSSVADGINLALFDPRKAEGLDVREFEVSRVSVDAAPVVV